MSSIEKMIGAVAAKVGAELVKTAVSGAFGEKGGALAGSVIDAIAGKLGVEPAAIPGAPRIEVEKAIVAAEADMPELIALWSRGLDGQFALLAAETKEGFWQSAWRWGWMYLLGFFWVWRILIGPAVNSWTSTPIELVDNAILLTLTTWFISLYMGGHTVKALGESAINAVNAWKDRK